MSAEQRIKELGIELPEDPGTARAFSPVAEHAGLLYVSGHGPYRDGEYHYCGKLGSTVGLDDAREAAKLATLNALSSVRQALGSLDRVSSILKVFGMVNSEPGFVAQPKVIDAASELLLSIFEEHGRHARSAVGVAALPMGICVEIEMILAVHPAP